MALTQNQMMTNSRAQALLVRALLGSAFLFFLASSYLWRSHLGVSYDPRNQVAVKNIREKEESQAFQRRLQERRFQQLFWPGLKSAHLSFIWLQTLSSLATEASYNEDYSWLFSKLYTFTVHSHPKELQRVFRIAPFLYVIGRDPVGSTLLAFETIKRQPENWASWYWAGFHALENLKDRTLAGDLYFESAKRPGSPNFVAALGLRLKGGLSAEADLRPVLQEQLQKLPDELLEKLKRARPELFQE